MPDLEDAGIDMDAAVGNIAEGLGFDAADEDPKDDPVDDGAAADPAPAADPDPQAQAPTVRPAPKSWAKEQHEHWAKIDPKAQEYIETREKQMLDGLEQYKGDANFGKQLRDVITPYRQIIEAQGVNETQAVQFLLSAHAKLSSGTPEQRQAYFVDLAKRYGIQLPGAQTTGAEEAADPRYKALEEKLSRLESGLTAREQAEFESRRETTAKQVDAFASDPAHPYFDEVADDIVALIKAGKSLEEAYEKAVWANPVTRQKELNRIQTEAEKERKEKAKKDAEAARKATGANVRSRDTRRAPTEPLGTMDETLKSTLADIRSRAN